LGGRGRQKRQSCPFKPLEFLSGLGAEPQRFEGVDTECRGGAVAEPAPEPQPTDTRGRVFMENAVHITRRKSVWREGRASKKRSLSERKKMDRK